MSVRLPIAGIITSVSRVVQRSLNFIECSFRELMFSSQQTPWFPIWFTNPLSRQVLRSGARSSGWSIHSAVVIGPRMLIESSKACPSCQNRVGNPGASSENLAKGAVQDNLRKWKTGGLRRISQEEPFKDLVFSSPARGIERQVAPHPSLKPQQLMRHLSPRITPPWAGYRARSIHGLRIHDRCRNRSGASKHRP